MYLRLILLCQAYCTPNVHQIFYGFSTINFIAPAFWLYPRDYNCCILDFEHFIAIPLAMKQLHDSSPQLTYSSSLFATSPKLSAVFFLSYPSALNSILLVKKSLDLLVCCFKPYQDKFFLIFED